MYHYINFDRKGCYVIQKYKKNGHAVIVDAHDERVATKPCDMVRPHVNQESNHRTGADLTKNSL